MRVSASITNTRIHTRAHTRKRTKIHTHTVLGNPKPGPGQHLRMKFNKLRIKVQASDARRGGEDGTENADECLSIEDLNDPEAKELVQKPYRAIEDDMEFFRKEFVKPGK